MPLAVSFRKFLCSVMPQSPISPDSCQTPTRQKKASSKTPKFEGKQAKDCAIPAFGIPALQPANSRRVCLALVIATALLLQSCGFFAPAPPTIPPYLNKHKIVCSAWGQIGKNYKTGGASPQKGFDCSGLVWWSYKQNGVNVPRLTTDQAKSGKKVSRKAAKPGDIVVFRTGDSPRGLHTGIYAGNGKFIHSPSSGKTVCLENLGADYWRKRLMAFRRITR